MSVEQITAQNFESDVLKSELPVLVNFYEPLCFTCWTTMKQLVTHESDSVKIVKINDFGLNEQYNVKVFPTLIAFRKGIPGTRVVGLPAEDDWKLLFAELRAA